MTRFSADWCRCVFLLFRALSAHARGIGLAAVFFLAGSGTGFGERFFEIFSPKVIEEKALEKGGESVPPPRSADRAKSSSAEHAKVQAYHRASLEVRIRINADSPTGKFYVKAYFMDGMGQHLMYAPARPVPQVHTKGYAATPLPLTMKQGQVERVRILVPDKLMRDHVAWRAVVVFGDDREASAVLVGPSWLNLSNEYPLWFDFPERDLCIKATSKRIADSTRLVEVRCKTTLPDYPYFTLFARLPEGTKKGSEVRGVLCLSLLANQIEDVRRSLLNHTAEGEVAEMIQYADSQKLLILCWASRRLWDPGKNWDELPKAEAKRIDERFDAVATAWEAGVKRMAASQGFEASNFLLWGFSASAQYAMRLAMRKPKYFSAVALQIPSSFDQPTKEASKVLWCLATGEMESGYNRSIRFYKQCRLMDYRFVYKAVPGLGHRMHGDSMRFTRDFLDYALGLPKKAEEREAKLRTEMDFPEFYGDWLNQSLEKNDSATSIPYSSRVSLPSERLARSWEMQRKTRGWSSGKINVVPMEEAEKKVEPAAPPAQAPADDGENTLFGKRVRSE